MNQKPHCPFNPENVNQVIHCIIQKGVMLGIALFEQNGREWSFVKIFPIEISELAFLSRPMVTISSACHSAGGFMAIGNHQMKPDKPIKSN